MVSHTPATCNCSYSITYTSADATANDMTTSYTCPCCSCEYDTVTITTSNEFIITEVFIRPIYIFWLMIWEFVSKTSVLVHYVESKARAPPETTCNKKQYII